MVQKLNRVSMREIVRRPWIDDDRRPFPFKPSLYDLLTLLNPCHIHYLTHQLLPQREGWILLCSSRRWIYRRCILAHLKTPNNVYPSLDSIHSDSIPDRIALLLYLIRPNLWPLFSDWAWVLEAKIIEDLKRRKRRQLSDHVYWLVGWAVRWWWRSCDIAACCK